MDPITTTPAADETAVPAADMPVTEMPATDTEEVTEAPADAEATPAVEEAPAA